MHQVPDTFDMERISKACDRLVKYMKEHQLDRADLDAIGDLCRFIHHIKNDVLWLETVVKVLRENSKKAS